MKLNKIASACAAAGLSVLTLSSHAVLAAQKTIDYTAGSGASLSDVRDGSNGVSNVILDTAGDLTFILDAGEASAFTGFNDWAIYNGLGTISDTMLNGTFTNEPSRGVKFYTSGGENFSFDAIKFNQDTETTGNHFIKLTGYSDGTSTVTVTITPANAGVSNIFTLSRSSHFTNALWQDVDAVTIEFPHNNPGDSIKYDGRFAIVDIVVDDAVASNFAPVVDLNGVLAGTGSSVSFTEGSGAVNIAPDASAADSDGDTITTITVALTNDQDGVSEGLSVSAAAQNALGGISGASDITLQDTISITGASATTADVATFLKAITYNNTSSSPNTTSRTVSVVINDGTENSISRTATISVANLTAASSSAAGFSTLDGTNLSPAIMFSSDNETLTVSSASHITGSTAQGGNGTDEIIVIDGSDLTQFTSFISFETLSTYNDGSLTLSESQHDAFTTINGSGTNTFTLASADGDSSVIADADIETYVLNAAFNITLSSAAQSVTGSSSADTVNIAGLSVTGALAGGGDTDVLQMSTGADISNATISAFESLTLSSGASVTTTEAQHDAFTTITGAGNEQITISAATDGLTGNSAVETYVLSAANTFTLGAASQNLTGSDGDDTVSVNALIRFTFLSSI